MTAAIKPGIRRYFPPDLDVLLAWSTLFRSEGTLSNYLAYVKTACVILKAPTQVSGHRRALSCNGYLLLMVFLAWQVFENPALVRAKASVKKAQNFQPREKMWIQRSAEHARSALT